MADNLTGWGRGTWSQGAWNEGVPVEATGLSATGAVGTVGFQGDQFVSVTGLSATVSPGQVTTIQNGLEAIGRSEMYLLLTMVLKRLLLLEQ